MQAQLVSAVRTALEPSSGPLLMAVGSRLAARVRFLLDHLIEKIHYSHSLLSLCSTMQSVFDNFWVLHLNHGPQPRAHWCLQT